MTIRGEPIAGEEIELAPGVHFVGLPEIPVAYKRPSDLLIDGVAWVHVKKDKKYLYIYAEGDDGDDLFYARASVCYPCSRNVDLRSTW